MRVCDCPRCVRIAAVQRDSGFWNLVLDNFSPYEVRRLQSVAVSDSVNHELRRRIAAYSL